MKILVAMTRAGVSRSFIRCVAALLPSSTSVFPSRGIGPGNERCVVLFPAAHQAARRFYCPPRCMYFLHPHFFGELRLEILQMFAVAGGHTIFSHYFQVRESIGMQMP